MKRIKSLLCAAIIASALIPCAASALGIEASVGVWNQDPRGDLSYKGVTATDSLSIENDLKYGDEARVFGRVKIDMPLFIPNVYLMATPMEFDGTGSKNTDFTFGGQTFSANVPFTSKVKLDHYDVGLYYSIPFIKTATLDVLNIELGIDARFLDLDAEISQAGVGTESKSLFLPFPMAYGGVQLRPLNWLAVEGEIRGISFRGDHYYDAIGRVKLKPFGPLFIAGGYRYEKVDVDEEGLKVDVEVRGPFGEAGVEF